MSGYIEAPLWGLVDAHTIATVALVDDDWRRENDRAVIDRAVERIAGRDNGRVSTNALRRELTNRHGFTVAPHTIGPRLAALTRQGVLAWDGEYELNDDTSGNAGKPLKVRRYVGKAAA